MTKSKIRNQVTDYVLTLQRDFGYDIYDSGSKAIACDIVRRLVLADMFDTERVSDIFDRAIEDYVESNYRNDDISDEEIDNLCQRYSNSIYSHHQVIYGNALIETLGEIMVKNLSYIELDYDKLPWDLKSDIEDFAFRKWYNIVLSGTVSSFKCMVSFFFYEIVSNYEKKHIRYRLKD